MSRLSKVGSSPLEINRVLPNVEFTIHTGTSMRIVTGSYHSADIGYPGIVADVYAIEGEWKIVESNENNILVVDAATFPLARMVQYVGANNNNAITHYEFPHHHMAPHSLSGTTSEFYDNSSQIQGLATHGDYLYFYESVWPSTERIVKMNIVTGDISEITPSKLLMAGGWVFSDWEFAVIDDQYIMIVVDSVPMTLGQTWAIWDWTNETLRPICTPIPNSYNKSVYYWHWAIMSKRLCINGWSYHTFHGDDHVYYYNYIYDITKPYGTKPYREYQTAPRQPYNWIQYPVCNDVIVGKKYFVFFHNGYTSSSIAGGMDGNGKLFVFDTEDHPPDAPISEGGGGGITLYEPTLNGFPFYMYHACHNPFNNMIYVIGYQATGSGPYTFHWMIVQINTENPNDLNIVYEYSYLSSNTPNDALLPDVLIPGMWEVYVVMENGDVYNVRKMDEPPTCHLPIQWEWPKAGGSNPELYWSWNRDMVQPDKCASCLDRWDRLWYVQGSKVEAINVKTNTIEISIEAGIPNVYHGYYSFPSYSYSNQLVYLSRDRVMVLVHGDYGGPGYPGPSTSSIYKIE